MRRLATAFATIFLCHGAYAQTSMADGQASGSSAGSSLSNSVAGNLTTGQAQNTIPGYTSAAPSNLSSNYGGGVINALGASRNAQCDQAGYVKNGSSANQECNVSVTVRNNQNVAQLGTPPTPSTTLTIDSVLGASSNSKVCGAYSSPGQVITDMQTCNEALVPYTSVCNKVLNPLCAFLGSPIKNGVRPQSMFGPIGFSASPTDTPGLYNYSIWGGGNNTEAGVTLTYQLDTVGRGSYMSINLSNLDDAMAIGVNDTTVFAGRPNPECNGGGPSNYFGLADSGEYGTFSPGYSECWTAYQNQCVSSDGDGGCYQYADVPYQQCVSGIKVADHCVRGSGGSLVCTPTGKMVYRPTEGCGTYGGSIPSATIPLVPGQNYIQIWWGNAGYGGAYGQFNITGQIYNVGLVCTNPWTDNCTTQKGLQ